MEINKIRWLNARLIHLFAGDKPYTDLARTLDKNAGLVTRWFFKKGFRKQIGHVIARHIEVKMAPYIIKNTGELDVTGWMDTTHYDLWRELLSLQTIGEDDEPMASYSAIQKTIIKVFERMRKNNAEITDKEFAYQVLKILPVYSEDEAAREDAIDALLLDVAGKMDTASDHQTVKKRAKKAIRKFPPTTKPI